MHLQGRPRPKLAIDKYAAITQGSNAGDAATVTRIETQIGNLADRLAAEQARQEAARWKAASDSAEIHGKSDEAKDAVASNQKDAPKDAGPLAAARQGDAIRRCRRFAISRSHRRWRARGWQGLAGRRARGQERQDLRARAWWCGSGGEPGARAVAGVARGRDRRSADRRDLERVSEEGRRVDAVAVAHQADGRHRPRLPRRSR